MLEYDMIWRSNFFRYTLNEKIHINYMFDRIIIKIIIAEVIKIHELNLILGRKNRPIKN